MNCFDGKVAVITGGGGILCSSLAVDLARHGARAVLLDLDKQRSEETLAAVREAGSDGLVIEANVLNRESLEGALAATMSAFGRIDFLINGAGGNHPSATTGEDSPFSDLPVGGIERVFNLNCLGTILASQVFLKGIAKRGEGSIVNISSMSASRPLTRVPAYSAAKAAVSNFTQWLAVYVSQEVSPRIRVNAIAPGFFMTQQNQYLLENGDGTLTQRGRQIIEHTPAGRFGVPSDLSSTLLWLLSPESSFVNGIVVPVDGGFSAYPGV